MSMVAFEPLEPADLSLIRTLLDTHVRLTGSDRAAGILDDFDAHAVDFIKIMPTEYKKVLMADKESERQELREPSDG